ncbi:hypothetical protein [Neisseria sp. Ec49-e6-T10]|uniref:hypothetical protein n=1 Tax=Neisseria sp. Ec49-e6-T10 TaxID=3140744 RepID=UPI003EB6FC7B
MILFHQHFLELKQWSLSDLESFIDSQSYQDYQKREELRFENKQNEITSIQKTIASSIQSVIKQLVNVASVIAKK